LQRAHACLERLTWRLKEQPEALDLVRRAEQAQTELTRLFEDIRVFTNAVPLSSERVNLADVWREAWQQAVSIRPEAPVLREATLAALRDGRGDRFRLIQVFRNLFENALDAGADHVVLTVDANEATQILCIRMRDNGHGIPEKEVGRVFEPFYTTKDHGSGLGMSICRRIMEAHGGTISIEGTENAQGTEVVLQLPWRSP